MAIIKINSDNPKFSYLMMKNPDTGLSIREYRNGNIFGYYSKNKNNQEYITYFKDDEDEISFKYNQDEEFEYNDNRRFNTPLFAQAVVNDFLRQFLSNKDIDGDEIGYDYTITINQMYMFDPKYINLINKYYKEEFNISYEELSWRNYRIIINTNKSTFKRCVNMLYMISIFYHCTNVKDIYIDECESEKHVKILNNLDAPYFIKYVIKSRTIRSSKLFYSKLKSEIDKTINHGKFDIKYGDTHYQRSEYILNTIQGDFKKPIIDIGCNNMKSYGVNLLKKLSTENTYYYGVDIDKDVLDYANKNALKKELDNLITYESIFDVVDDLKDKGDSYNVIFSEVFEHIKLKEDTKIIKYVLNNLNVNKMIITTPNKDFNKYYLFNDDDTRLDDHVFEMSKNEFMIYFNKLMMEFNSKYDYKFCDIGDIVNGFSATQCVLITKK